MRGGRRDALLTTAGNSLGVLIALGVKTLRATGARPPVALQQGPLQQGPGHLLQRGSSAGSPTQARRLAATIVVVDLVWFSTIAYLVTRAKRAFVDGPWLRRVEKLTGAVLVGLGVRLALERR
ncbi:MAG TPA: LysE family transporter [Thermoleophilaceae bacterium]|nr:LysE family transporter [Thermoleophilaceae bacterium]